MKFEVLPSSARRTRTRRLALTAHPAAARYARPRASGARRSAPSVQTLVRGHWKHQPHGKGRSERKYIFVEPYWRGPEDAPITVRPHALHDGGLQ